MKKLLAICIIFITLSGCSFQTGDGLLSLPKLPSEYVELQKLFDKIQEDGASLVSAKTGANRQAVQLTDLDADGENEVISFFRQKNEELTIYVHKKVNNGYVQIGELDGVGKNIKEVSYITTSASGRLALIVSWEIDELSQAALSVYNISDGQMVKGLDLKYLDYAIMDIDLDATGELIAISKSPTSPGNKAYMYKFDSGTGLLAHEVPLSIESDKIINIAEGMCASGKRGLFVDSSTAAGQFVTDIIVYSGDTLVNESVVNQGGSAAATMRSFSLQSMDVDGDGVMEVPTAKMFFGYKDPLSTDTRWQINWVKIQRGKAVGNTTKTFYSGQEGWYIILPDSWEGAVTVSTDQSASASQTTFFVPNRGQGNQYEFESSTDNTLLTVFVYTGDSREQLAENAVRVSGVKIFKNTDTAIYGYKMGKTQYVGLNIEEEQLSHHLRLVMKEWNAEELMQ